MHTERGWETLTSTVVYLLKCYTGDYRICIPFPGGHNAACDRRKDHCVLLVTVHCETYKELVEWAVLIFTLILRVSSLKVQYDSFTEFWEKCEL
jgi:hypothetical protein